MVALCYECPPESSAAMNSHEDHIPSSHVGVCFPINLPEIA